jgi:hypothetical protein
MRRCDIISGILLILSIIDFALAAPVLLQEKRQASVDVVHVPKDVMTVLGKRGDHPNDRLAKLALDYFKKMGNSVGSSDAHASSSLTPPGTDQGSTNVVQAPASNSAPSIANPDPLLESSSPSAAAPMQGS